MPKTASSILCLLAALVISLAAAPAALAVDTPFSPRFADTMRGDIRAVGNTLLTCPAAAANCTNAQAGIGSGTPLNNNYNMGNVDVDSDAATFNSSSATVSLPAGSTVVWAGLYWGADTSAGTGGAAALTPASRDSVRFNAGSGYQTISASATDVLTSTVHPTGYRAFRDVTSLLPAAGNGTYTVANVQAGTGDDRFAGWALIVAYRDDNQAIRRLNVYDGLGSVDATNTFSTNIGSFFTPSSGPVTTTVGLVSYEGDAGIASESMTFAGSGISDALNPANNGFNSTISSNGADFTAKTPNYRNQMGIDIDAYTRTGLLTNSQSSAVLAFSSTQDYFMPSALYLVSDEGPAVNTSGPTIGGVTQDSATLTADPGAWQGTPTITYGYQWQRCDVNGLSCTDISGATGQTYDLTGADVGSTIRVVVIADNDAGGSSPATSSQTATVLQDPPANTGTPTIAGVPADGEVLTADQGTWTGTDPINFEYQWQRCDSDGSNCVDIGGATAQAYQLVPGDVGHVVLVVVTGDNGTVPATASSPTTAIVGLAPPVAEPADPPALAGATVAGQTLTADPGQWSGADPIALTYQWQQCDADGSNCVDIAGATGDTYILTSADVGHTIVVVVTGDNGAGNDQAASAPSAVVTSGSPPANGDAATEDPPATGTRPATPAADAPGDDVGAVPGNLVADTSCQQLLGNAKYRRIKLVGIGTVRLRAYTRGPAMRVTPMRVSTQVTGGRATSVRYQLDGNALKAKKGSRYLAKITPAQLKRIGTHRLKAMVKGKRGAPKPVVLVLKTVPCRTLFTAQRWKTTAGAGLRLRVDARTALQRIAFRVPAGLLPKQASNARTVGFVRFFIAGQKRRRFALVLPRSGIALLGGPGKPAVTIGTAGVKVTRVPARATVAEITLYRVTKLDNATRRRVYKLSARVLRAGFPQERFSARPAAPR
ncbi:MAG: DUF3344 domain-containing protein [Actinomycetota bacterium]|nr:DUF3344 domain-containing protein [Actinomycetota bacterium]